eukprot:TRINITY_DN12286_c0_g3_i1.p1 TRINITY_DN12286_c0_g3~~TRINITY_DN12286_c0_g3_i1.p1  ORF type:complete len:320 (+),score=68.68 TRINITY_DN12286_c0_g3_i1:49-1008(+)
MEWGAAQPRVAGKAGSGGLAGSENVRMLTADIFKMMQGKRKKTLPASALKVNSTHRLWSLERTYRFYCSASGKWVISDEVAYDEKLGTFQSAKEYQRAVRPRNGMKQQFNFWPQLGVGQVRYNELSAAPSNPYNNPAAAFIPSIARPVGAPAPAPSPGHYQPAPDFSASSEYTDSGHGIVDTESTAEMFPDSTTVGDHSSAWNQTERGDNSSVFGGQTEATSVVGDRTSQYEGNTDYGSTFDASEAAERFTARINPTDRIGKVASLTGVDRGTATLAVNEFDSMDKIPKQGSKEYSNWLREFSGKHGFKPDILIKLPKD